MFLDRRVQEGVHAYRVTPLPALVFRLEKCCKVLTTTPLLEAGRGLYFLTGVAYVRFTTGKNGRGSAGEVVLWSNMCSVGE